MIGVNTKKIGINGSMLDEHPTGVGVYCFNLINHLSAVHQLRGIKSMTVFTPSSLYLHKHIRIIKLPALLLSSRYGKIAALCRFLWNTFSYPFQAKKYNLLISPSTHGSFLLRNQVITVHDLISLHFDNISSHQRFYFRRVLPFLLKKAKIIVAVSECTRKDIIRFFQVPEDKIRVIHNGYDTDRYFPAVTNSRVVAGMYGCGEYFLAVGPTYPHKNFELLIDAYHAFVSCRPGKINLLIAGGKEAYLQKLKHKVVEMGLQDRIVFTGYVPASVMPDLYREAFALIFPSLYEGFGIPLLEAMGSGCPVIVSETASMPEVCGDAGLYINPHDMKSLLAAMVKLHDRPELRGQMIDRGISRASLFSWRKMALAFDSLIETSF